MVPRETENNDRAQVAQMAEHRAAMQEVMGSNFRRINTLHHKITEEKVLPLKFHLQMVRLSSLLG